ncbi:MAG TPA: hypothetical protein VFX16_14675 [Pseudonocardiaceae bacterium]|nr:hypothetical protein [Pseudonocardiaceae bacterium]
MRKLARYGLEVGGGLIPFAGGLLSAAASAWSDHEQDQVNSFFKQWLHMLEDEMREKEQTIFEIVARLDMQDDTTTNRMNSPEYQSLLRKAFREWSAAESEKKRALVRNILANAAATSVVSDDVVKMFLDWLRDYSELHFEVIGAVYNNDGITRGAIWRKLGREIVREDTADADLYKLLIRDLSIGGVVRQHVDRDYYGNAVRRPSRPSPRGAGPKPTVSAFDDTEPYELTDLGKQFVHYAMTDLPLRIEAPTVDPETPSTGAFQSG